MNVEFTFKTSEVSKASILWKQEKAQDELRIQLLHN